MRKMRLDDQAVAFYRQQGYYLFREPVFSQEKFDRLVALFEELLAAKSPHKRADELDKPHFEEPRLFEFLMADEVLDLVEPLIGPNIGLWSSHFIAKEPLVGRATPWHEDSSYWKGRLDRMDQIVTIWLALDRTDRENGCLRVIPGSHLNGGFSEYEAVDKAVNTFGSEIRPDLIDESKAVDFELEPNTCSLHDGRIIHGADANTSSRRRAGYTMRYFSLETRFIPDGPGNANHKLWLCRGVNVANNPLQPLP
ncbi:MAG: phytanoyl-CoA dioxygenase family protein [Anaerolineae bacterium]|nr:phytanoyl-CoA dioxygenase family protein [Anaerolineae bacterium]MDW8171199.1 phytanoyl-CoA dioxygenase family protein [Anaerolineae bacterium]